MNRHKLENKNIETLEATCSICGPTEMARRVSRGKEYYICRVKMNMDSRNYYVPVDKAIHRMSNKDLNRKIADCSICGPKVKTNIRGNCLNKIKETANDRWNIGDYVYRMKDGFTYTSRQKQEAWAKQNQRCAICKDEVYVRDLCMDHDHKTLEFRGLICGPCNKMLGFARDNKTILQSAIKYLEK